MTWQTRSTDSGDTEKLGEKLGKLLGSGGVIELRSDLGGGKTTFVRGLARGLGSRDSVTSPTFTLNQIYQAKKGLKISHFDFYRLNEPGIIADELAESLEDANIITVVEWSDIVQDVLPKDRITIEFKPVASDSNERQINFIYPDSQIVVIKKLETEWVRLEP